MRSFHFRPENSGVFGMKILFVMEKYARVIIKYIF